MKPIKKLVAVLAVCSSVMCANSFSKNYPDTSKYKVNIYEFGRSDKSHYYVCPSVLAANRATQGDFASSEMQTREYGWYYKLFNSAKNSNELEMAAKMLKNLNALDEKKRQIDKYLYDLDRKILDTVCTSYEQGDGYDIEPKIPNSKALEVINKIYKEELIDKIQVNDNGISIGK